ncbi:hypothetical protein VPH35_113267 [Triticum aestivum]
MPAIAAVSDRDHFGDLTDDLLSHVLSFLPSDDALQTCVLDTRWRDLWRRTTSLHFNVDDCELFRRLVKLIIQLRGKSPLVKCDIITCPDDYAVFGKWQYMNTKLLIEFALMCQVKELTLSTVDFHAIDPPVFDVPFISHHLKTINLHRVKLKCPALNFSGCPILEELKMQNCNICARKISSKSLKHLCISDSCVIPVDFRIRIFAPDLISLLVADFCGATPFLEDMPFLVTASVGLDDSCYDLCSSAQRGCGFDCCCNNYPTEGGVLLNGLSNAVNLELILTADPVNFIYRWDLEWCPIFSKLKTLLLNEWFTAIDLACILQHSPILEMLTLQLGNTKSLTRATAAQETIDQSFVCAHLKVVNIESDEVHEEIHKIVNILRTCGILRDHISIKARSSPSCCFSFQKDPRSLLPPPAALRPAASTTDDGN